MIPIPADPLREFATARSLPLTLMRFLTRSGTVSIAGSLAPELGKALGRQANIFAPPCALTGLDYALRRFLAKLQESRAQPSPLEADIMIITDREWARELLFDGRVMRSAAMGVRRMMILPFEFVSSTPIEVAAWSGFGPAGADGSHAWRWCNSQDGVGQITVLNRLSEPKEALFSFELNTHDGSNRPVFVNGKLINCDVRASINVNLGPGLNYISLNVEQKLESSIINGTAHHFNLMSPEIADKSNEVLISQKQFILSPDPSPEFLNDRCCREKLHSAGFRYVGGFHRSTRGGEPRLDVITAASIFDPSPALLDPDVSYSPPLTNASEIAWRIASHRLADLEIPQ